MACPWIINCVPSILNVTVRNLFSLGNGVKSLIPTLYPLYQLHQSTIFKLATVSVALPTTRSLSDRRLSRECAESRSNPCCLWVYAATSSCSCGQTCGYLACQANSHLQSNMFVPVCWSILSWATTTSSSVSTEIFDQVARQTFLSYWSLLPYWPADKKPCERPFERLPIFV